MDIFLIIIIRFDLTGRVVGGVIYVLIPLAVTVDEAVGLSLCIVSLKLENNTSFNSFKKN
jgi:hypothetical protein